MGDGPQSRQSREEGVPPSTKDGDDDDTGLFPCSSPAPHATRVHGLVSPNALSASAALGARDSTTLATAYEGVVMATRRALTVCLPSGVLQRTRGTVYAAEHGTASADRL